ncbi:GtrA family protein [uncultured Vagococcus sp.]|uniref:GtrA family protein n=1 Tax=uncultured Vagococcus sp. TaxID=189676 RepID=UPI0028D064C8|nr:GtrA family protein [uncultured Vagococcus sp.]
MDRLKQRILAFSFMNKERYAILMYLVMGGFTTAINILVFWVFNAILGMNYSIATIIAWIVSVLFAYVSNKLYVFESKNRTLNTLIREIVSFVSFRLLSLLMDLAVMYICVSLFDMNALMAKIVANIVVLVANYAFSKWFIFRK